MMKTIRAMLIVLSGLWAEGAFAHSEAELWDEWFRSVDCESSSWDMEPCTRIPRAGEYPAWVRVTRDRRRIGGDARDVVIRWGWNHPDPNNAFNCVDLRTEGRGECIYQLYVNHYGRHAVTGEIVLGSYAGAQADGRSERSLRLPNSLGPEFIVMLEYSIYTFADIPSNISSKRAHKILAHTHYNISTPPEPDPPQTPPEPDPPTSREWCKAAFIPAIPPKREGIAGGSLRITNPDDQDVDIRVSAKNTDGESQHVEESRKRIVAGGQIKIDLVEDEDESGSGWWSVLIESERDRKVHVTTTARRGEEWLTLPVEKLPGTECSE